MVLRNQSVVKKKLRLNNEPQKMAPKEALSSNMLEAKKSGRVFYPSKVTHFRHNSHDNQTKVVRQDLSPLNRSHDNTCGSSSGITDSSSKEGSGSKVQIQKPQSERVKDIIQIKLNFEDDVLQENPTLIVGVVSKKEGVKYELDPNDIKLVFEKFGDVANVEIVESCNQAVVTMEDLQKGQEAEKYFNFYQLPGADAYLTVKWLFGDCKELQRVAKQKKSMVKERSNSENKTSTRKSDQELVVQKEKYAKEDGSLISQNSSSKATEEQCTLQASIESNISKECTSVSKFTTKYEIPIRDLPGFYVARKIIGHRGKNMKSILGKLKKNNFKGPIQDVTRLRLRGQGSGLKEGPNNCESPEPLYLCISSKYYEKYSEACHLVENLLKDVCQEYNNFCKWKGRPIVGYNVRKLENNPAWYLSNLFDAQK
ncbi:unnamed protein product [Moneuplotes crassus]|uniref:KHDC4/BBP-like KH-domain type I domain-containing protein n=1 Tax=Euplotes crassus TaxID=5936 RepID=A0AAD1X9I1_EUPCR|nr:unnamed protein product [Moneuplotes crassus]